MSAARLTILLALLLSVICAGPAAADVFDDFRDDGQIETCQYSDGELRDGLNSLPPDVLQYSPGLADQLAAGREGCGGGAPGTSADTRQFETVPAPGAGSGGTGGSGGASAEAARIPKPPAPDAAARQRLSDITAPPVSATSRSDVPGWVVALLVAGGLAAIALGFARTRGLGSERILRPLRASFAEARGRTADAAVHLFERARLGR